MGIGQHFLSRLNYVIWWFHASTTPIDYINIFCAKSNSQCIASGNGQWFLFLQKQSGKLFLYLNLRHTDILTPGVKNLWDTRCVSFVEYTQRGTESTQATQTQWRFGTVAVNLVRARIRKSPSQPFLSRHVTFLPNERLLTFETIISFPIWANQSYLSSSSFFFLEPFRAKLSFHMPSKQSLHSIE